MLVGGAQSTAHRFESCIGHGVVFVVESNQSRNIHYPLIHLSPLRSPRNGFHEPFEEEVRASHPIAVKFHPGASRKMCPLGARCNRRTCDSRSIVQEGGLEVQSPPPQNSGNRTYVRQEPRAGRTGGSRDQRSRPRAENRPSRHRRATSPSANVASHSGSTGVAQMPAKPGEIPALSRNGNAPSRGRVRTPDSASTQPNLGGRAVRWASQMGVAAGALRPPRPNGG